MSKRKVNINKAQPSTEEILAKKNFNAVLSDYKQVYKPIYKKTWFLSSVVVATVTIVTAIVMKSSTKETTVISESTNKPTVAFTYEPKKDTLFARRPFIDAPIKTATIEYSKYKVSATKKGQIKHKTGTTISIPKNAFVDVTGKPIKGNVEIRYREFHDIEDIYLSGIPMTYDSAGQQYHFESAGMLDIQGFQNDKQVFIAPDKKIDFEMKSNDDRDMFNFYSLDTVKKNWKYLGRDVMKNPEAKPDSISYNSIDIAKEHFLPKIKKAQTELVEIKKDIVKIEKTKPVVPQKVDPGKFHFNLEVNANEYPELAVYKDVQFEVNDDNFDSKYYKVTWDDAKLSKGSKKLTYNLTLIKDAEQHVFNVQPALEGKNYEIAKTDFDSKYDMYTSKFEQRKVDEAKKQRELDSLNVEMANIGKRSAESLATSNEVYRLFSVKGFGTYNCDRPQMLPKGADVIAKFVDEDGKPLDIYSISLAEKGRNAIFSYYGNNFNNFKYNPNVKNIIWGITNKGYFVLVKLNPSDPHANNRTEQKFIMTIINNDIKSKTDLQKLLEI